MILNGYPQKDVVIRIAVNGYTYLSKYRCISQY
uniref:Uncharacterized protein n=1 Tax=Escherichia coli TaxID=562 RepID=A0A649Z4S2_ECOLX|nr:hypothetical protein [Escherichia coli]UVX22776.1 hypothetical protein [Escherichia coli]